MIFRWSFYQYKDNIDNLNMMEGDQVEEENRTEAIDKMKMSEDFAKIFRKLTYMVENIEPIVGNHATS